MDDVKALEAKIRMAEAAGLLEVGKSEVILVREDKQAYGIYLGIEPFNGKSIVRVGRSSSYLEEIKSLRIVQDTVQVYPL